MTQSPKGCCSEFRWYLLTLWWLLSCLLCQFVFAMAFSYLSRWFKLWLTFGILYFFTGNFIDAQNDAKMAIDKRPLSLSAILAGNLCHSDEANIGSCVENRKTKTQWKPVKPKTTAFNWVEDGKFKSYILVSKEQTKVFVKLIQTFRRLFSNKPAKQNRERKSLTRIK